MSALLAVSAVVLPLTAEEIGISNDTDRFTLVDLDGFVVVDEDKIVDSRDLAGRNSLGDCLAETRS